MYGLGSSKLMFNGLRKRSAPGDHFFSKTGSKEPLYQHHRNRKMALNKATALRGCLRGKRCADF